MRSRNILLNDKCHNKCGMPTTRAVSKDIFIFSIKSICHIHSVALQGAKSRTGYSLDVVCIF